MFWFLLAAFGIISGVTTVLFGFGGGFVAVPLVFALTTLSYPPGSLIGQSAMHIAVATSTAAMMFGAGLATFKRHREGKLQWGIIRPLLIPVAIGAIAGALLAVAVSGAWIQWVFVAYLGITVLDNVLRPGFMHKSTGHFRPMSPRANIVIGLGIGLIAAFLGVGGSVLSVPVMRRRGASMAQASALANPVSLPMAVAGSLVYVVLAWQGKSLGSGFVGYINLPALSLLIAGSWCGIRLAAPFLHKIPDVVYARMYILLLVLMFFVMLAP